MYAKIVGHTIQAQGWLLREVELPNTKNVLHVKPNSVQHVRIDSW